MDSNTQPMLSVAGLQKRIRGTAIVRDATFEVFPGEVFGFLGPNGAGKTTTIRMLVGLIRPTRGRIFINGINLRTHPQRALRQVGCIVENPDLYPYLTGYENLLQLARMQGPRAIRRIGNVADRVNLTDRLNDRVGAYSLGMRQRLGIAQALLCDPQLLILDEPTNGLDPAGIRDLRLFLRQLANEGMAVFVSSHLLAEMELMCDRVAILQNGSIIKTGMIHDLLARAHREVRWRALPLDRAASVLARFAENVVALEDGTIRCDMDDDHIPAASRALTEADCAMYAVSRPKFTLENVFMATTGGANGDFSIPDSE